MVVSQHFRSGVLRILSFIFLIVGYRYNPFKTSTVIVKLLSYLKRNQPIHGHKYFPTGAKITEISAISMKVE